jgi:hypothetical protein
MHIYLYTMPKKTRKRGGADASKATAAAKKPKGLLDKLWDANKILREDKTISKLLGAAGADGLSATASKFGYGRKKKRVTRKGAGLFSGVGGLLDGVGRGLFGGGAHHMHHKHHDKEAHGGGFPGDILTGVLGGGKKKTRRRGGGMDVSTVVNPSHMGDQVLVQ